MSRSLLKAAARRHSRPKPLERVPTEQVSIQTGHDPNGVASCQPPLSFVDGVAVIVWQALSTSRRYRVSRQPDLRHNNIRKRVLRNFAATVRSLQLRLIKGKSLPKVAQLLYFANWRHWLPMGFKTGRSEPDVVVLTTRALASDLWLFQ